VLILANMLILLVHTLRQPFVFVVANRIETCSLIVLVILSVLVSDSQPDVPLATKIIVSILSIGTFVILASVAAYFTYFRIRNYIVTWRNSKSTKAAHLVPAVELSSPSAADLDMPEGTMNSPQEPQSTHDPHEPLEIPELRTIQSYSGSGPRTPRTPHQPDLQSEQSYTELPRLETETNVEHQVIDAA